MACRVCLSTEPGRGYSPLQEEQGLLAATLGLHLGPDLACQPSQLCRPCRDVMQDFARLKETAVASIEFVVNNQEIIQLHGLEAAKCGNVSMLDAKEEVETDSKEEDFGDEDDDNGDEGDMADLFEEEDDLESDEVKEGTDELGGYCDICKKEYLDLNTHRLNQHNVKRLKCTVCGKVCPSKPRLKMHMKVHTGQNVSCPKCGKLIKETGMPKHVRFCSKISDILCTYPECGKLFKQPQTLTNHINRVHLNKTSLCINCGEEVKHLSHHKTICNPGPAAMALRTCKFCQKVFSSKTSRSIHEEQVHGTEGPSLCGICGKALKSKYYLDNHMKNMHSAKEKRFLCDVDDCGKMFKTSAEVKQHNDSVHLKLREQCGECGQWFNAKHLKTHVKRVHGGAERADHFCDTCSKTFFKASDLRLHIARVHDDEGIRHACPECGKQVRRLPEHMRTVHGACGT